MHLDRGPPLLELAIEGPLEHLTIDPWLELITDHGEGESPRDRLRTQFCRRIPGLHDDRMTQCRSREGHRLIGRLLGYKWRNLHDGCRNRFPRLDQVLNEQGGGRLNIESPAVLPGIECRLLLLDRDGWLDRRAIDRKGDPVELARERQLIHDDDRFHLPLAEQVRGECEWTPAASRGVLHRSRGVEIKAGVLGLDDELLAGSLKSERLA